MNLDSMTRKELIRCSEVWGFHFTSKQTKKDIVAQLKWSLSFIKMNNPQGYEDMINKVSQG